MRFILASLLFFVATTGSVLAQANYMSHQDLWAMEIEGVSLDMSASELDAALRQRGWSGGYLDPENPTLAGAAEFQSPFFERNGSELIAFRFRDLDGTIGVWSIRMIEPAPGGAQNVRDVSAALIAQLGEPSVTTELGDLSNPSIRLKWASGSRMQVTGSRNPPREVLVYEACNLDQRNASTVEGCPEDIQTRFQYRAAYALRQQPTEIEITVRPHETGYSLKAEGFLGIVEAGELSRSEASAESAAATTGASE